MSKIKPVPTFSACGPRFYLGSLFSDVSYYQFHQRNISPLNPHMIHFNHKLNSIFYKNVILRKRPNINTVIVLLSSLTNALMTAQIYLVAHRRGPTPRLGTGGLNEQTVHKVEKTSFNFSSCDSKMLQSY